MAAINKKNKDRPYRSPSQKNNGHFAAKGSLKKMKYSYTQAMDKWIVVNDGFTRYEELISNEY